MTDEALLPPEQIAEIVQQRQELLDLIGSSQETIARCEEMLTRVDAVLERINRQQAGADQPGQQQQTGSGLLAGWLTRKAS